MMQLPRRHYRVESRTALRRAWRRRRVVFVLLACNQDDGTHTTEVLLPRWRKGPPRISFRCPQCGAVARNRITERDTK